MSFNRGRIDRLAAKIARDNYAFYVDYTHRGLWIPARHNELICNQVEAVERGDITRLMVFLPPRHGKSMTISESFPSWFIGRDPNRRVIEASYGDSLAKKFGGANKKKIETFGKRVFDIRIDRNVAMKTNWNIDGYRGGMISAGIGGALTGEGADCFPAGTMIATAEGEVDIKDFFHNANPPLVFSYDHASGKVVLKRVIAIRRVIRNDITTIKTTDSRVVNSTGEHPFFTTESGYREAKFLTTRDRVLALKRHDLPYLQRQEGTTLENMPHLLQRDKKNRGRNHLRLLLSKEGYTSVCLFKSSIRRSKRLLLFCRMLQKASRSQEQQILSCMWRENQAWMHTLPKQVLEKGYEEASQNGSVFVLPKAFSCQDKKCYLLFCRVCFYGSCGTNEGTRKLEFQRWKKLRQAIPRNEGSHFRKRQSSMLGMRSGRKACLFRQMWEEREENKSYLPPYRRRCHQQLTGEPGNDLQNMPCSTPQVKPVSIQSVESHRCEEYFAYDLQIEGTSNFFANGILVHNCLIIDDPVKNRKEAESETYRQMVWDEWQNTLLTRLHPGGRVIIILTRWHEKDLAGKLLAEEGKVEDGGKWHVLSLPAVADANDPLGREEGEPLWPEHGYDLVWAEDMKKAVGSYTWASLYQQQPRPKDEARMLRREWFRIVPDWPRNAKGVRFWDLAATEVKKGKDPDFTAGAFVVELNGQYWIVDVRRTRTSPLGVENLVKQTAELDSKRIHIWMEQEPGSSGVNTIDHYRRSVLKGYTFRGITATGSKELRAFPLSAAAEAGNVFIVRGAWNKDFLDEADVFGTGAAEHDDQVDAVSGAFEALNKKIDFFAGSTGLF